MTGTAQWDGGARGTFLALVQMQSGPACVASNQGSTQFATAAAFMVAAH